MKHYLFLLCFLATITSSAQNCDSLKRKNDSLLKVVHLDEMIIKTKNYQLNRVRFYINICMKNPKQDKFLKGWVRRAVSEQ